MWGPPHDLSSSEVLHIPYIRDIAQMEALQECCKYHTTGLPENVGSPHDLSSSEVLHIPYIRDIAKMGALQECCKYNTTVFR